MTFAEALRRSGVRFRVGKTDPGKVHLCCPFCAERGKGEDREYRLCVHARQGWGRCVHCDWRRRSEAALTVLRRLAIGAEISDGVSVFEEERKVERISLPEDFFKLVGSPRDGWDRKALQYVLSRGATREQIEHYQIGVSYVGRYAYRTVFPVFAGRVLKGIVARDFTGKRKPKYLNSLGEMALFGFDPGAETCVLAEGVFKALRLARVVPPGVNSAAVLGHDLTEFKIQQLLGSCCRKLIFYPDPDRVGRHGVVKMADRLYDFGWKGAIYVVLGVQLPADEASWETLRDFEVVPYTFYSRAELSK